MTQKDVYERLAEHLSHLGMSYPFREELVAMYFMRDTDKEACTGCGA